MFTAAFFGVQYDTASVTGYMAPLICQIPTLQYIGLQTVGCQDWDKFKYKWWRVVSRPDQGLPVIEKVSDFDIDLLERQLLATPRD